MPGRRSSPASEFTFDAEALRHFVTMATQALQEMDHRHALHEAGEHVPEEPTELLVAGTTGAMNSMAPLPGMAIMATNTPAGQTAADTSPPGYDYVRVNATDESIVASLRVKVGLASPLIKFFIESNRVSRRSRARRGPARPGGVEST